MVKMELQSKYKCSSYQEALDTFSNFNSRYLPNQIDLDVETLGINFTYILLEILPFLNKVLKF